MQELEIQPHSKDLLLANPDGLPGLPDTGNWSQSPHLSSEESSYEKTLRDLQRPGRPRQLPGWGWAVSGSVVFHFGHSVLRGPGVLPPSRGNLREQALLFRSEGGALLPASVFRASVHPLQAPSPHRAGHLLSQMLLGKSKSHQKTPADLRCEADAAVVARVAGQPGPGRRPPAVRGQLQPAVALRELGPDVTSVKASRKWSSSCKLISECWPANRARHTPGSLRV